jgi:general secretion pathway protein I
MTRQRGYTLIEVIVAFAVLALALTLLLGTLTNSSRQVRWSADAGRAAMLAQSVLDESDVGGALDAGTRSGDFEDGRYRWTMDVRPYSSGAPTGQPVDPNAPVLMSLDLTMQWGDGARERLVLHSLRLVPPHPPGSAS